jgi:hypothetical protein
MNGPLAVYGLIMRSTRVLLVVRGRYPGSLTAIGRSTNSCKLAAGSLNAQGFAET